MKDYEKMWYDLKEYIKSEKEYYKKGVMCSLSESIVGKMVSEEFLKRMEKMEKTDEN